MLLLSWLTDGFSQTSQAWGFYYVGKSPLLGVAKGKGLWSLGGLHSYSLNGLLFLLKLRPSSGLSLHSAGARVIQSYETLSPTRPVFIQVLWVSKAGTEKLLFF